MKKVNLGSFILIGFLLTLPLIGVMFLANQLAGLPFVPFDLFDWITRLLPGPLITVAIDLMIDTMRWLGINVADNAKTAEQFMASLLFLAAGTFAGAVFLAVMKKRNISPARIAGILFAALFGLPLLTISMAIGQSVANPLLQILWLVLVFLAWGWALNWALRRLLPPSIEVSADQDQSPEVLRINRRQFLITLGVGSAAITVVGAGVGTVLALNEQRRSEIELDDTLAHTTETSQGRIFPNQNDPVVPAPGTRPEYTPIKDHYSVFIRTEPTEIDGATWVLPVIGMVDKPLMLTLEDLKNNYPSRDQYVTLSCISGRIGSDLIGTTYWTGVSLQDILADALVQPQARSLYITCGDGYYESVDLELIASDERIMLCYAWDGNDLSVEHGFPLRIWIPDLFGMKQPRWITGLEITDVHREGYWVRRGWSQLAKVKTTSVIDTVAVNALIEAGDQVRVPIGGIAWSGDRGISKVEIRVDGGPWIEASLRSPLSETTWVIWRLDWLFEAGDHTFEVRCVEADGTAQIETPSDNRPDGATGIHSFEASL